jgi:hypothetical protein
MGGLSLSIIRPGAGSISPLSVRLVPLTFYPSYSIIRLECLLEGGGQEAN